MRSVFAIGLAASAVLVGRVALAQPAPPKAPPPPSAGAAAPGQRSSADFEGLDLAELLDMSASVASKQAEAVSQTPGMITAYSEHDMRRFGYYTIGDLANITAGYSTYSIYGEQVLETRGQKAGSFNNNKHLVLVDEIPVNHGRGNHAFIDQNWPLFFASQLEFLKGPASALYGTGAFFGVVNITSKELDQPGYRAEGRGSFGSAQDELRVMANASYRDKTQHASLSIGVYDKGSSGAFVGGKSDPSSRLWDRQLSEFIYARYGVDKGPLSGLNVGLIFAQKNGGIGEGWNGGYSPQFQDLTWTQLISYVKYEKQLVDKLVLKAYVKAQRDREKGAFASIASPDSTGTGQLLGLYQSNVTSFEGQLEVRWTPRKEFGAIGGVNVNVNYQNSGNNDWNGVIQGSAGPLFVSDTGLLGSSDVFQTYSPYLQLQSLLPVLKGLHLTAGARLDAGRAVYLNFLQVSPRAAVVQELTDFLSLKLLYGTALRAPGNKEIGLNFESRPFLADPALASNLVAETIRSFEEGIFFHTNHVSASWTLFFNQTNNALDGTSVPGKDGTPKNIFENTAGKTVARGTEVEVQVAITPDARLFANYAFAHALTEPVNGPAVNVSDVPIHKINGGASYRLRAPIDLTATVVGRGVTGYRVAPPVTHDAPGYFLLDANVIWRATEHVSLEIMGRNLTGQKGFFPANGLPSVPLPGPSVSGTLDVRL